MAQKPYSVLDDLKSRSGLLTVKDVAALFRISTSQVYSMANSSSIPCMVIGGQKRFDPKMLTLWVKSKDAYFKALAD